jgi:hypothetical protein
MRPKPLDLLLIAVALAATVFVSAQVYTHGGGESVVDIRGKAGEWAFPLSHDREIRVEGPEGSTLVSIHGGIARIESSPCPNQTCVLAGGIDRPGQWLACLPNEVFVRIEGGKEGGGLDGATF